MSNRASGAVTVQHRRCGCWVRIPAGYDAAQHIHPGKWFGVIVWRRRPFRCHLRWSRVAWDDREAEAAMSGAAARRRTAALGVGDEGGGACTR